MSAAHAITDILRVARGARAVLSEQAVIACQRIARNRLWTSPKNKPEKSDTKPNCDAGVELGSDRSKTPSPTRDISTRPTTPTSASSAQTAPPDPVVTTLHTTSATNVTPTTSEIPSSPNTMRVRRVPETPLSRFLSFATLGVGLAAGAAFESARRTIIPSPAKPADIYSSFITPSNATRLANTLSRMRGAALKLGQMLSIQDSTVIPPELLEALERVRQSADVMPASQVSSVMTEALGNQWRERVKQFEDEPFAAASIGQVHKGVITVVENGEECEKEVVFKVQYPGVARSISSDLGNLKRLVSVGNFVPDGFFLDQAIKVAQEELSAECDYIAEGKHQTRYRELVGNTPRLEGFYVPEVFHEYSSSKVLVSERVTGVPIDKVSGMDERVRNSVAGRMMRLVMAELFVFGFQQSDPNWSNYLYDPEKNVINLIDFGAAKEYSEEFLMNYLSLIRACADQDKSKVIDQSIRLGFLTGEETKQMLDAHVAASFAVGEPFNDINRKGFDFRKSDIPARTAKFGKVMLKYRLTPPPKEAYSLHRRLSGAFLMSTRLGAVVKARESLDEIVDTLKSQGRVAQ